MHNWDIFEWYYEADGYFDVIWLFFQANLILINHRHRPSLAKSECMLSVQKGGRETFNKSKSKFNSYKPDGLS